MIIGYIRVSTDKQTTKNQQFEIFKFADKKNMKIDEWVEETISGRKRYQDREWRCCINRQKVACHRISAGGTIFRKTTPNNFYEKVKISNT